MSDIFISYKREEQDKARKLANALERQEWTVWWDPKLRAGEHFDDVIEAALLEAKCVIVLWSKLSVTSRYVKDEATYALNRNKLAPVAIEDVKPPFRFEGIHTPQLIEWDGLEESSAYRKLLEDISVILGPSPALVKAEAEAKRLAEEEERRKIEVETKRQAEEERQRIEAEARRQAEEEARRLAEEEAQRQRKEEERRKAEEEAKRRAEEEERQKAEAETRQRAEEEKRCWAEEERQRIEVEEQRKKEEEARRRVEEEAQRQREEEQRRKNEEETKQRVEREARQKADAEARQRAEEEKRKRAEEEERRIVEAQRKKVEEERVAVEEEQYRSAEAEKIRVEEERRMAAEAEAKRLMDAKQRRETIKWLLVGSIVLGVVFAVLFSSGVFTPKPSVVMTKPSTESVTPGTVFRDTLKDGTEGPEMVVVPAGSFTMGDIWGDGDKDEKPTQPVQIPRPFALGKYEVTFNDYDKFAKATGRELPSDRGWGRDRRPVINVSWKDAEAYAEWLSQQTGKRYRLPSEAEWEYAARSGGKEEKWAGTSVEGELGAYAWYSDNKTYPGGEKKPNGLGLYDMSGNVGEWVEDCWHESYNGAPDDGSAWKAEDCGMRVIRDSFWGIEAPWFVRTTRRNWNIPYFRDYGIGFRLAQDI